MNSKFRPTSGQLALVAALLSLGFALFQEPVPSERKDKPGEVPIDVPDENPIDVPLTPDREFYGATQTLTGQEPFERLVQGLWRLESVVADDWPQQGIDQLGYLLVAKDFMSFEIQAYWDNTVSNAPTDAYETFTAEYQVAPDGRMAARILMGSYIDRSQGTLEWYKSTVPKRFVLTMNGPDTLRLEWQDKRAMNFTRHKAPKRIERDFFGAGTAQAAANSFYNDTSDPEEITLDPEVDPVEEEDPDDDDDDD